MEFTIKLNRPQLASLVSELEQTALDDELAIARAALTVVDEGLSAEFDVASDSTIGQFIKQIGRVINDDLRGAFEQAEQAWLVS